MRMNGRSKAERVGWLEVEREQEREQERGRE